MADRLSDRCRKDALKHKCSEKALKIATDKCKSTAGPGRNSCMTAAMEAALIKECRDVVCPNDPLAVVSTIKTVTSAGGQYASGGGYFDSAVQEMSQTQQFQSETEPETGGVSTANVKLYLGIAAAVLLGVYLLKK